MTNEQLNNQFKHTQTTPSDFIEWAKELGVKVHDATISRHRAGTQGITSPWEIAYKCFFAGIITNAEAYEYRSMKVLIPLLHGREDNEWIIEQCEKALPGYWQDEEGETYWFQADDDKLVQVFEDEEKNIEWTIASLRTAAIGTRTEVTLVY